ncbi:uncharacterized protein LOC133733189 [Rosa rugosa]|uniref:uncharacterized protein LOC133733189 n=1 Tax=Rosa rugosa TaxID=74645 RepID=UPI002B405E00|nr:uncharacterized protein LOC133733189 [Rosa rugosa]
MLRFKKLYILHPFLLILNFLLTTSISQNASTTISDEPNFHTPLSPINQMIICKSQKPHHKCETLNITHSSCSSSLNYASPNLLSAGFSSRSNSLLLYNCSNSKLPSSPLSHTLTCLHTSGASSKIQELEGVSLTSCLLADDLTKLDMEFNPCDLNCSCYGRVYRKSSGEYYEEHDFGTRIAFEVPDHIPNICNECQKANGNCSEALRCICHPKECKNKVISKGGSINSFGYNILVSLLPLLVVIVLVVNP